MKLKLSFLLVVLSMTFSCQDDYFVEKPETRNLKRITKTSLSNEIHLIPILNQIGLTDQNGKAISNARTNGASYQIITDSLLKVLQPDSLFHSYSFYIQNDSLTSGFENLILRKIEGGYLGYILRYEPDKDFSGNLSLFSGIVKRYNLDNELLKERQLKDGKLIQGNTSNGRETLCLADIHIYTECDKIFDGWDQSTGAPRYVDGNCVTVIEYEYGACPSFTSGGGGDDGGTIISDPGSSTGGSVGSGSTDGSIDGILPPTTEEPAVTTEELLEELLETDPFALIEIPCDQIYKWQTLAQHEASVYIKEKINELDNNAGWFDNWAIQALNGANGTIANMDYFSVTLSTLPKNPATGVYFTAEGFLDYFRRNINDFAEGSIFTPYCETSALCIQETDLWNSVDPEGALIYIDIPGDDGVVVCSEYTSSYWYFMTLEAPGAGNHPVSGTRQFGFEKNRNGTYNFFVRGVDRFDSNTVENTLYMATLGENPFFGADALWSSFQNRLNAFVNSNGGNANINVPVKYRPDWDKVKDVLEGTRPISDLGCK